MKFVQAPKLKQRMQDLCSQSKSIDIAVAWVCASPVVTSIVEATRNARTKIRIVTGVGRYLTDPAILRQLAPVAELRIFGEPTGQLYHPKLYIFCNGNFRTVLVGSANLTAAAVTTNLESVFEFSDLSGASSGEFNRFWQSPIAVPFSDWDADSYEAKRKLVMSSLTGFPSQDVVPSEVLESTNSTPDVLKAGWSSYISELRSVGKDDQHTFKLENWLFVLDHRRDFIERDWNTDLTDEDLAIMYGKGEFAPFGQLNPIQQQKFLGAKGRQNRKRLGAAVQEAAEMKVFQEPVAQKLFENLCSLDGCGPALATRLLALACPAIFVVVNKKSFQGLAERFHVPVPRDIKPKLYAELLKNIQRQPWCRSPRPADVEDRKLWDYRTALIDPLVYRENIGAPDD